MGMFDTVTVECKKCGEPFTEQSKGGDCLLSVYTLDDAPLDVIRGMGDRDGVFYCTHCSAPHKVKIMFATKLQAVDGDNEDIKWREE